VASAATRGGLFVCAPRKIIKIINKNMKRYCSNCGKESSAETKFCPDCGKKMSTAGDKIIGWYKQSDDHFLCKDCFLREKGINKEDYKQIEEDKLKENIYTCDRCGKEIDIKEQKTQILPEEEKQRIEEEERVRAETRAKYNQQEIAAKKKRTSPLTWLLAILIGIPMLIIIISIGSSSNSPTPSTSTSNTSHVQTDVEAAQNADATWKASPAGQICATHPTWGKTDCDKIAARKVWIGMSYDMLIYLRGKPDNTNVSNYGSGNQYQYCWNNHTPSCFYDDNNDGILDSYN
jgi:hypothetical protein